MGARRSPAKAAGMFSAAVAAAASAGLWTSPADAGLTIDLRAVGSNLPIDSVSPKFVSAHYGSVITVQVVARISGTNAAQFIGDFDGEDPATDKRNDDSLQSIAGSFKSTGSLMGDFDPSNQGSDSHILPFRANGSQNGSLSDWDSDGDLDIGNSGSDVTSMWVARAAARQFATLSIRDALPNRLGWSDESGRTFREDHGGPHGSPPATRMIDAQTSELFIGELAFQVTSASGDTSVNFVPRPITDPGAALWWEDNVATNKMPNAASYMAGAPIFIAIPEPASASVLGLAALGLLARRKQR